MIINTIGDKINISDDNCETRGDLMEKLVKNGFAKPLINLIDKRDNKDLNQNDSRICHLNRKERRQEAD